MDGKKIIIPQKAQVEEVREIESEKEIKLETPKVEKVEEEKDIEKKTTEGFKDAWGGVNLASGGTATVPLKAVGKIEKGLGKVFDNEDLKIEDEVHDGGADKPVEWAGEVVKKFKKAVFD